MEDYLINLANRMNYDFYIGVVGSVRSGKSSFINRFFELKVLPFIKDEFLKNKIVDELPQTQSGKSIMTVEPKFIPSTSINVDIGDNVNINVRMVDSVGYIIPDAIGYEDSNGPRYVKTPWFSEPILFKEAALLGTKKIMESHSNLGIVMTSDGTIGDFTRNDYKNIEHEIIPSMKELNKPFVVVLNSKEPNSDKTLKIKKEIEEEYNVSVVNTDVINMTNDDLNKIFMTSLDEFNIVEMTLEVPDYINYIDEDISIKKSINDALRECHKNYNKFKDVKNIINYLESLNLFKDIKLDLSDPSSGMVLIKIDLDDTVLDSIIKEILGVENTSKSDLIKALYEGKKATILYGNVKDALNMAKETGYGISIPSLEEMTLLPPTLVKQSGRYGVKLCAKAPSIHMIKVDVESTFTPIIGSEDQSQNLIESLVDKDNPDDVWNKEIFGRKLSEMVNDGIKAKIYQFPELSKDKLRKIIDKLVNTSSNSIIAIVL